MTVIAPADAEEARKATVAAAELDKPVYLRFAREKTPIFTTPETPFKIGKAQLLWKEKDPQATIVACGSLVHNALLAANELSKEGVATLVLNNHTIKPLDEDSVLRCAEQSKAIVTVEEHQVTGGMGSAVAEFLAKKSPVPIEFVGVQDKFGQSGKPEELIEHYGMGVSAIKDSVKKVVRRK